MPLNIAALSLSSTPTLPAHDAVFETHETHETGRVPERSAVAAVPMVPAASPPSPEAVQRDAAERVMQALDPLNQGIEALHAALQERYTFEPITLQVNRKQAENIVKPWGLQARVQAVVRRIEPQALVALADALANPLVQGARVRLEMAASLLGVPLPEKPEPSQPMLQPDRQLLRKLSPKLAQQCESDPVFLAQARQFLQQCMPAGGVGHAIAWLDNPAYTTMLQLEKDVAAALAAVPEMAAGGDALARQMAPQQQQQCDEALLREPKNSELRRVRADLAAKLDGNHQAAIADLTEVVERDGVEGDYLERGTSYAALGDWMAAEEDYGRAALFAVSSQEHMHAFLQMARRCLDGRYPDPDAAPLNEQVRRAMLTLGLEGHAAAAPAIAKLQRAAPAAAEVQELVELATSYQEPDVVLPPAARITSTPQESGLGPITGQPLELLPVFSRLAERLDVQNPLINRSVHALQTDFALCSEVLLPVRAQLQAKAGEFTQGVAEALQKVCSVEDAHAIEGLLAGPAGDLICGEVLPLAERIHAALTVWMQDIGISVADVRVPRDLRGTPMRQLLEAMVPSHAAADLGGALGVQCDLLAWQLKNKLAPQDLQTLLGLMQTEPFGLLCGLYRRLNDDLFIAMQGILGKSLPELTAAQREVSDARLADDPNDLAALEGRAMALMTLDMENAGPDLERLVQLDPSAKNYRRRAAWKLSQKKPDAALADAQEGARRAPRSAQSYVLRSEVQLMRGEVAEAVRDALHARLLAVSAEESLTAQMAMSMAYDAAEGVAPTAA